VDHAPANARLLLNALDADDAAFRQRMTTAVAWATLALNVAALLFAVAFLPRSDQNMFVVACLFASLGPLAAHYRYSGIALLVPTLTGVGVLTWTTLFVPHATMSPLYLLLLAIIIVIVVEDGRTRLVSVVGLWLAAIAMRLGHHALHGVPIEETATYLFDTVNVFGVGALFTLLHRRRRSHDLQRLRDALLDNHALTVSAIEARDAARQANDLKSDFLARISHELRTPLNAIIGYSELLEEEELVLEEGRPDLAHIHTSGNNLLGLVDDLLDLTKVEAGQLELVVASVDLVPLLEEAAASIAPMARRHDTEVVVDVDLAEPVDLDAQRVRQIVLNLLGNAAKFTMSGRITLSARVERNVVVITVADTGVGIDPSRLPRLFEPFVQGSQATQYEQGGTGLGLAICDRFVRQMGGHIAVQSTVGVGSTFTVVLPRTT